MPDLTRVTEDYLKNIWAAAEWTGEPVTATRLSERLGLAPSTVSEAVKRLTEQGLVEHAPYGAVALSEAGRCEALKVVRRHRLIETFLSAHLGYSWDEVHAEAEVLEHAVSDLMIERLDALLGRPSRDPHGDPIPSVDGVLPALDVVPLSELEEGGVAVVRRVSDRDPEVLRYLRALGMGLDVTVRVVKRLGFNGTVTLALGTRTLDVGLPVAADVWVAPVP